MVNRQKCSHTPLWSLLHARCWPALIAVLITGAIRTVTSLDYESQPVVKFSVRVTDLGRPRLSSDTTARVTINVLDANDCAPVFTQAEYNASVLLPTYKNVAIAQVSRK